MEDESSNLIEETSIKEEFIKQRKQLKAKQQQLEEQLRQSQSIIKEYEKMMEEAKNDGLVQQISQFNIKDKFRDIVIQKAGLNPSMSLEDIEKKTGELLKEFPEFVKIVEAPKKEVEQEDDVLNRIFKLKK